MLATSMSACKKSDSTSADVAPVQKKAEAPVKVNDSAEMKRLGINHPVRNVFSAAYSSATGAYATIKVKSGLKMDGSAWVGLCPQGKDYYNEREADDVDIIYFHPDAYEEGQDHVFACDFSSVEDGTYALVVATSDDENAGYIAIQLEMTKTGDKIEFDYTNAKLNNPPAK